MKKILFTFLSLLAAGAFAAVDCTAGGSFKNWGSVVRCDLKRGKGTVTLKVKGGDPFLTISGLDIDTSRYDRFEMEYRGKSAALKNNGQIYFAGKGQSFSSERVFVYQNLRNDGQWHKVVIEKLRKGPDSWKKVGKVTRLRLDIIDGKAGEFEIRSLKAADSRSVTAVYPGEDDFADVSAKHLHIVRMGKKHKHPFWIGKSNRHDHWHRGIFRFPLETLVPRGEVKKAVLELRLLWYSGLAYERKYAVEAYPNDIQKIKPLDVKTDAVEIGRVKIGQYSGCETVTLDVTKAVNEALGKIHTALTLRIRPVPEANTEPNPSGAVVDTETVRLVVE